MGRRIIGISPGTRNIGIAILHDGKLVDWSIHEFKEAWSDKKLHKLLNCIKHWLRKSKAESVAIKLPDELPVSKPYIQLIGTLNTLLERKGYKVIYYTLSDLKKHWCQNEKTSKATLAECLVVKYGDLLPEYHTGLNCKTGYYDKLFEAVAAASLAHYKASN